MGETVQADSMQSHAMISFLVCKEEFCIDVLALREIGVWTAATPADQVPDIGVGVKDLRGVVLPIIDFASRLGLSTSKPSDRHAILVVQVYGQAIGLLVERVTEVMTISNHLIRQKRDMSPTDTKDFISGFFTVDGRMICVIAPTVLCR